jgi:NTE family protein
MSDGERTKIALACQGGGTHTAYTAGVLAELAPAIAPLSEEERTERKRDATENEREPGGASDAERRFELTDVSGASGGASCALLLWYGLLTSGPERAQYLLERFWERTAARSPIDALTNDTVLGATALEEGGAALPSFSPYVSPAAVCARERLRDLLTDLVDFEEIPALAGPSRPTLHVGAVGVLEGSFRVFRDEGITPEAILASSALPTLLQAVEIGASAYWDGLFAENPPLLDLLAGPIEHTPEEIWVVRINPTSRPEVPRSLREIADRRNELSGNLSLEKDLAFIEQVNEWLAAGYLPEEEYKHVEVRFIDLDRDLSPASKLDRDPEFIEGLIEQGHSDARAFLADR